MLDLPPSADVPRFARVVFAQDVIRIVVSDSRDSFIGDAGSQTHIDCAGGRTAELGGLSNHEIPPDG